MTLSWVSVDARTGNVIADVPDLTVDRVGQVLGTYTSATATLPLPTAPEGWERATLHGGACMVLLDDVGGAYANPIWGGMVTSRKRGSGDTVSLSLASIEAYLDRCYVGDWTYTATGQNTIVADLVERFVTTIPIRVQIVGGFGAQTDRAYKDADDKTVLSAITELAGVEGGPEWTVGWEWQHSPERLTPVLYVGDRIGVTPAAGLSTAATFDMPGCVTQVELSEDFTSGKGATDVMATSTATSGVRPQSPHQAAAQTQRPSFQFRYSPSTSITDTATLTTHAQQALALMADGAKALSLTAAVESAPRLGVDWSIGDDVGYSIGGLIDDPRTVIATDVYVDTYTDVYGATARVRVNPNGIDSVPAFPGGLVGTARCLGWEMTLTEPLLVTPILELEEV